MQEAAEGNSEPIYLCTDDNNPQSARILNILKKNEQSKNRAFLLLLSVFSSRGSKSRHFFFLPHLMRAQTSHHSTTRFHWTKQQTTIMQTYPYLVRQNPVDYTSLSFLSHQCLYCIRLRRTGLPSMGQFPQAASLPRLKYKINEHYQGHSPTSIRFFVFFFLFTFLSWSFFPHSAWVVVHQWQGPTSDERSSVAAAASEADSHGLTSSLTGSLTLGDSLFTSSFVQIKIFLTMLQNSLKITKTIEIRTVKSLKCEDSAFLI